MKKLFLIALLIMALAIPSFCMAADNAHAIAVSGDIGEVVAIADGSTGNCTEVDSSGNLAVEIKNDAYTMVVDADGAALTEEITKTIAYKTADGAAYNGAATVYGMILSSATAGDAACLYDAATATGTPVFDIVVLANSTTSFYIPGGVAFATDVYVDVIGTAPRVMVIYDH